MAPRARASTRVGMLGRLATKKAPARMVRARTMAMPVEASAETASRIRDMRNMKVAMVNSASTGMATGSRFTVRPRCSPDTVADAAKIVTNPTTTPAMPTDGPQRVEATSRVTAAAPAIGMAVGPGRE